MRGALREAFKESLIARFKKERCLEDISLERREHSRHTSAYVILARFKSERCLLTPRALA
jgi:hypothetical protein